MYVEVKVFKDVISLFDRSVYLQQIAVNRKILVHEGSFNAEDYAKLYKPLYVFVLR
ncbi:protein of unknown function [Maridesulfovibrio hydrothermalis AM13 = DSM 14728]|uniref:Uncharacterized protein n=1 Tax=Maridesulfovibrio hydrothermalis AM13 = DSM 14728 TaxID=1121451 RepID=L0RBE3_9BACT|nr:protein of unknown function [Maridesulfovibrio hydrothermalis AM13 = DSM 14728]